MRKQANSRRGYQGGTERETENQGKYSALDGSILDQKSYKVNRASRMSGNKRGGNEGTRKKIVNHFKPYRYARGAFSRKIRRYYTKSARSVRERFTTSKTQKAFSIDHLNKTGTLLYESVTLFQAVLCKD